MSVFKVLSLGLGYLLLITFPNLSSAMNAQEVYHKVNKSVYTIYTVNYYEKKPEALGSAIAVTEHILATNCHVALTGNYLGIVINNEFKLATIFFRDPSRDICFVEVPGISFAPVKIRDSKDVKVGELVFAVGNPEGLEKSISQGIVSNKRQDRGGYVLQTDATVSFGSSGGGLFDQNGDLIGITNSVDKYSRNIAFAIPSEWISQILFPKSMVAQVSAKPSTQAMNLKSMGVFGKDKITLYQSNKKCFVYLVGKNEFGEPVGSALWYPEKPFVIILFPGTMDIHKAFQIMNKEFYNEDAAPTFSNDYLYLGSKRFPLVGVRDENGKFSLLVTKIPQDAKDQFAKTSNITAFFADGVTVQGFSKIQFGFDGFEQAMNLYQKECIK